MSYKIVRYYKKSNRRKVIRKGLTREDAKRWCQRPDTVREGVWFDGFVEEK